MARILVVDDDEGVRSFVAEALERGNHQVTAAGSSDEAVTQLQAQPFDLLITDLQMPGRSGLELLAEARAIWPRMGALVLTAHSSLDIALTALQLGAHGFVPKPVHSPEALRQLVGKALIRATLTAVP
jgi:two-component system response regulator FlrC